MDAVVKRYGQNTLIQEEAYTHSEGRAVFAWLILPDIHTIRKGNKYSEKRKIRRA